MVTTLSLFDQVRSCVVVTSTPVPSTPKDAFLDWYSVMFIYCENRITVSLTNVNTLFYLFTAEVTFIVFRPKTNLATTDAAFLPNRFLLNLFVEQTHLIIFCSAPVTVVVVVVTWHGYRIRDTLKKVNVIYNKYSTNILAASAQPLVPHPRSPFGSSCPLPSLIVRLV